MTTGSFGTSFSKVKVIEVVDNWVKIEDGKGQINLINTDYITNIKVACKNGEAGGGSIS